MSSPVSLTRTGRTRYVGSRCSNVCFENVPPVLGKAEERHRATVAAGSVHLPADRALGGRRLDHRPRVHADEVGVQPGLGPGIGNHGPTEGVEIPGQHGVAGRLGGVPEGGEHRGASPARILDHLTMHCRRVVGPPHEDQRQQPAELFPHRKRLEGGHRVMLDLDVIDPPEGGAKLVLNSTLASENIDLEAVGGGRDLVLAHLPRPEDAEPAQYRHRHGRRSTGSTAGRNGGMHAQLHPQPGGRRQAVDGRLQQGVAGRPGPPRHHGVALAEVADVEDDRLGSGYLPYRHLDAGSYRHVEDSARTAEPGVGPSAVVAYTKRR